MRKCMLILAVVLVCTLAACDSDDMPEELVGGGDYAVLDAYIGARSQGPAWFWVGREDSGAWQNLFNMPEWGDSNWQFSNQEAGQAASNWASLNNWNDLGNVSVRATNNEGRKYTIAVAFEAPNAGTVTISNFSVISFDDESGMDTAPLGDVAVKIWRGTTELASTTIALGEATAEVTGTVTGVTDTALDAGERIYIGVDPLASDRTGVDLSNLVVQYTPDL